MAYVAPIGNQFWQIRSKHGRDRIFATPDLLMEATTEYFQWCVDNPLIEIDFKGKDAERVEIPKMRVFTLQGLCSYLGVNGAYLRQFKQSIAGRTDDLSRDFSTIILHIEETIYNQKFTGAAAGFLNPNIIARDLGLAERTETRLELPEKPLDYSQLSESALKELNAASEN